MVSQKLIKKQAQEIQRIKEVLAEVQIYVQKHQVSIGSEMVDDIKLKVTVESLRNEMEIRFDLALRNFFEQIKTKMENYVTMEVLDARMLEKLHKREFEKHYERLDAICKFAENKVETAIPAIKYQMEQGIRSKADVKDLKEKASAKVVDELINRLNKLEEQVKFEIQDRAQISESDVDDDEPIIREAPLEKEESERVVKNEEKQPNNRKVKFNETGDQFDQV